MNCENDSTTHIVEDTHIAQILPIVEGMVQKLKHLIQTERDPLVQYELEARFGRYQPASLSSLSTTPLMNHYGQSHGQRGQFRSGVADVFMQKVMRDVGSYEHWFHIDEFQELQDFVYNVPTLGNVRTTVQYDDKVTGQIKRKHIRKDRIESAIFQLRIDDSSISSYRENREKNAPYIVDMRIDLNREQQIRDDDPRLPALQNTTHMRIKQRKSYQYASQDAQKPTWQFDLTFSWSGRTKTEAERQQKESPPVCEIECEFVNPKYTLLDRGKDPTYVAKSLLYKMADFIPFQSSQYKWVSVL